MKYFKILACIVSIVFSPTTYAITDCNDPSLKDQPSARAWVLAYGRECAMPYAISKKAGWKLPAGEVSSIAELDFLQDVWKDLLKEFIKIERNAQNGAVHNFAAEIRKRAALTSANFLEDQQKGVLQGNALYLGSHWSTANWILQAPASGHDSELLSPEAFLLVDAVEVDCANPGLDRCRSALNSAAEISKLWAQASLAADVVSKIEIKKWDNKVRSDNREWIRFRSEAKTMLPLDFKITDWIEGRSYSKTPEYADGNLLPPKKQWFLLHPSLAMENVSSAADGQQLKPILQMEIIGINWWDKKDRLFKDTPVLKWFSGLSLIATYADRNGVKDTGFGVLVMFDNRYSIGVTQYGNKTGLSISMDLFDLLKNGALAGDYEAFRKKLSVSP